LPYFPAAVISRQAGGKSLDAVEKVQAVGAAVAGIIAIIDRLEGGSELSAKPYIGDDSDII
jgi:orotate phosphoribosyltransferase